MCTDTEWEGWEQLPVPTAAAASAVEAATRVTLAEATAGAIAGAARAAANIGAAAEPHRQQRASPRVKRKRATIGKSRASNHSLALRRSSAASCKTAGLQL